MRKEILTTREAADFLGVSVSQVQLLVETGELEAWKTSGGHRRIPLAAIMAYKGSVNAASPEPAGDSRLRVLLVEDDPLQRAIFASQIASLELAIDLTVSENGYKALLEISRITPDLILSDVVMEGMDGLELIRTILATDELSNTQIAVLTGLSADELQQRGGVPVGVATLTKPTTLEEMRGFLSAHCAIKARHMAIPEAGVNATRK